MKKKSNHWSQQFFARFKIVDLIFVTMAIIVLASFYWFFKRETVEVTARFKIVNEPIFTERNVFPTEFVEGLIVGDEEKNEVGVTTATITDVDVFDITPEEKIAYVTVRLTTTYSSQKNQYSYKGEPLLIGEDFYFSFSKVKFKALVVEPPETTLRGEEKMITVMAQTRYESRYFSDTFGVPEYMAVALKEGMVMAATDGEFIAEIVKVERRPARKTIVTGGGGVIVASDPLLYDVFLELKVKVRKVDNKYYMFNYLPVTVDQPLPLHFETVSVWPTITDVIETLPAP